MQYNHKFDIEVVFEVLRGVNERYQEGSPEDEALRVAAVALFYLREIGKLEEYREFFRSFYTPAIDYVAVAHAFETREEAEAWLAQGNAHDGDRVKIAGQGFRVIPERKGSGLRFLRSPLPEELVKEESPHSNE